MESRLAGSNRNVQATTPKRVQGDRFIPNRAALDIDKVHSVLTRTCDDGENKSEVMSPSRAEYKRRLADAMGATSEGARILAFKTKAPDAPEGHENSMAGLYTANSGKAPSRKAFRQVPTAPERILDAPELVDDYYLNLLDWSSSNTVAIALGPTVYLWNAGTGDISQLMETRGEDNYVTSVSWAQDGKHVAVGTRHAEVQIWDAYQGKQIRQMRGHSARVSATAWSGAMLATGGADSVINTHDVRQREHLTGRLVAHEQEVCGLKWAPSGQQLASGGNDNLLCIWDAALSNPQAQSPLHRIDAHQAAVKALAWCPFQSNLIASGGGSADRCIKFWNTHTGACVNSIDTGSQVTALQWNRHEREILSSHGYSQNQLCLWKYPSLAKMAELNGHTARILGMSQSPDGSCVVSAGADETLRFWNVFGESKTSKTVKLPATGMSLGRSIHIR